MKRRIRKRRILKWIGVGLCIGFSAAWIVGLFGGLRYSAGNCGFACYVNGIEFWTSARPLPKTWEWRSTPDFYGWWPRRHHFNIGPRTHWGIVIPYWMLILSSVVATTWLWWSDRRPKAGCTNCNYNLTGNVSGVCPECGRSVMRGTDGN